MNQPHHPGQENSANTNPPVLEGEILETTEDTAAGAGNASAHAQNSADKPLDKAKAQMKQLLTLAHRAFTEHPAAAGETYWQHLAFTLGMGARLMFAGFVILLHGILPFTLTYTGSNHLKKCNKILSERAQKAQMPCESPLPYGDNI